MYTRAYKVNAKVKKDMELSAFVYDCDLVNPILYFKKFTNTILYIKIKYQFCINVMLW